MKVLVTGGTGYIGSHTTLALLCAGHETVLVDNYSNSGPETLAALRFLSGCAVPFFEGDIRDRRMLDAVFADSSFDAVFHFAALKAARESVAAPLRYYANNVSATVCLVEQMAAHDVRTLIFSSSATVYGAGLGPLTEDEPADPVNPYGRTKLMVEQMLRDLYDADSRWRVSILRYFNAAGAHNSGMLGDSPAGPPQNLLPRIAAVAAGDQAILEVYGDDHPTPDGTCIRDYIHVVDVAGAHVEALHHLRKRPQILTHNLGAGVGYSVLEVVRAFERVCGRAIPYRVVARRPGDIAVCYADPARARHAFGWEAVHGLDRICVDSWRWQLAKARQS